MADARKSMLLLALLLVSTARLLAADPAPQAPAAEPKHVPAPYMRVSRPSDKAVRLEVALRRFDRPDGKGPAVWLAGVIHVGERGYYDELQKFLDAQGVVLYEGVGIPAFADGSEADDATRVRRTREAIAFLAGLLEGYHARHGAYPLSLGLLRQEVDQSQPRSARWIGRALRDGWGEAIAYKRKDNGYTLTSLGADRAAGGEGHAADVSNEGIEAHDVAALEEPGIQNALADGLGLVFQLDAINYDRDAFVPCDMTADQLAEALHGEGAAAGELNRFVETLRGESIMGGLARFGARLLQAKPEWAEMFKIMMIEMVGSLEGDLADSAALPPRMRELMQVIIRDRNEIVMRAVAAEVAREAAPASVAVFYGAGHMDDLERRLVAELGYRPAQDIWVPAFGADAARAGLSDQEMLMIRQMIQLQMKQMNAGR